MNAERPSAYEQLSPEAAAAPPRLVGLQGPRVNWRVTPGPRPRNRGVSHVSVGPPQLLGAQQALQGGLRLDGVQERGHGVGQGLLGVELPLASAATASL